MSYKINISEFNKGILFQRLESVNNAGLITEVWKDLYSTRARINSTSGKEYILNEGISNSNTTKFTIRFNHQHEVTTKDRIVFKNKTYDIRYINNVYEDSEFLEIVAEVIE